MGQKVMKMQFSRSIVLAGINLGVLLLALLSSSASAAFTLSVTDAAGTPLPIPFRWMVEEDTTAANDPAQGPVNDSLSFTMHSSHAPVVASGEGFGGAVIDLTSVPGYAADKRYFVSVLPGNATTAAAHQMGGSPVPVGASVVDVILQPQLVPTAQISVQIYHDNRPLNNEFDSVKVGDPEAGLEGFTITLEDMAGQIIQDAFGNPLGTQYETNPITKQPILDVDGTPMIALDPETLEEMLGDGVLYSGTDGLARFQNIPPGKYGVHAIPPIMSVGEEWRQTSTIEGKKTIDAWVEANEPFHFQEFGPAGPHVSIGFIQAFNAIPAAGGAEGDGDVSGTVRSVHNSRPPEYTFYPGAPVPGCWVGLNEAVGAEGLNALYAQPCDDDSSFNITGIPEGIYQLAIWDGALDYIFATRTIVIPPGGGDVDLGDIMMFAWFGRVENVVYFDLDENGILDESEKNGDGSPLYAMPEQNINLRFRDGTIYQAMPTDLGGEAPFDEVFPFFHWLVAEVDFARYKATGMTATMDAGGEIPPGYEVLAPQLQIDPDGNSDPADANPADPDTRTSEGLALTQAFQNFLGTTIHFDWGKTNYPPGENGGISGVVMYATTRAEDDVRFAAGEEWEPGIPRVQMTLYEDMDANGVIDDKYLGNAVGPDFDLADVDNWPFNGGEHFTGVPGPEDIDRDTNGAFDLGDAVAVTITDSFDDSKPTGCPPDPAHVGDGTQNPFWVHGDPSQPAVDDCFDGLRTFVQARDGVFDGGYAFDGAITGHAIGLPQGTYIVEAATPPGYLPLRPEDKNVDFGDQYVPSTQVLPPICVGDDHLVPDDLVLFPGVGAPFAGETLALCNRKQVAVDGGGLNAAADFWLNTQVPKAARIVGFILDDLSNEFNPLSPQFGEKYAPPWVPVSIRDYTGAEISRVYSDEFGQYNALVPSTFTVNAPSPSGVVPNVLTVCLNDPGPVDDGSGNDIIDPHFKRQYSQFCYTFQYLAGMTTYLDTPVLPIAAHAGPDRFPLDCEPEAGTPRIAEANGPSGGPVVDSSVGGTQSVTLTSAGTIDVLNPLYDPTPSGSGSPRTLARDYGFGSGTGDVLIDGVAASVSSWADNSITFEAPAADGSYQISVRRDNGNESTVGITLEVLDLSQADNEVIRVSPGELIQDAVDSAVTTNGGGGARNVVVLVEPGFYEESVILHKNVKLQGYGESTIINALQNPGIERLTWREKLIQLETALLVDVLPGQPQPSEEDNVYGGLVFERGFTSIESPPVFVMGTDTEFRNAPDNARIDGFMLTGADSGGGIGVNGFARGLEISNNRIVNNAGTYGGGVRIGVANLTIDASEPIGSENPNVRIHNNHIAENGGISGPGGITLNAGADNYSVADNYICGNFSTTRGAGIAHQGLSDGGSIVGNKILFNEAWNGTGDASGGGIALVGNTPALVLAADDTTPLPPVDQLLSLGTGSVTIDRNLIQGNSAGTGSGGGIFMSAVNGQDVVIQPDPNNEDDLTPAEAAVTDTSQWFDVDVTNNMIVNNVAGKMGAIFMQDAVMVRFAHNTVANNDATSTSLSSFTLGSLAQSTAQPSGVVASAHSNVLDAHVNNQFTADLASLIPDAFSNPELANNIHWNNRSFYWAGNQGSQDNTTPPAGALYAAAPPIVDFAVVGTAGQLAPTGSVVTDKTVADHVLDGSNELVDTATDPGFVDEYSNSDRNPLFVQTEQKTIEVSVTFDEQGNFLDIAFGPLTPSGDYHLTNDGSNPGPAEGLAQALVPPMLEDIDGALPGGQDRTEAGADEIVGGANLLAQIDVDVDGIVNLGDNCVVRPNSDQRDPNQDGFGAMCDPDLNQDLITNFGDFAQFVSVFVGAYEENSDFNGDGVINFGDLGVMATGFGLAPGPSGVSN